jgi:hypothetical protein
MMDQLLDVSVAQGEAEIQPNRVLIMCGATRWRRYESKAIARGYPSRSPVSVKIPAAQQREEIRAAWATTTPSSGVA